MKGDLYRSNLSYVCIKPTIKIPQMAFSRRYIYRKERISFFTRKCLCTLNAWLVTWDEWARTISVEGSSGSEPKLSKFSLAKVSLPSLTSPRPLSFALPIFLAAQWQHAIESLSSASSSRIQLRTCPERIYPSTGPPFQTYFANCGSKRRRLNHRTKPCFPSLIALHHLPLPNSGISNRPQRSCYGNRRLESIQDHRELSCLLQPAQRHPKVSVRSYDEHFEDTLF